MKRLAGGLLALVVGASMLTACTGGGGGTTQSSGSSTTQSSGGNTTQSSGGDTIKIGMALELSGAVASYGTDTAAGVEMAADEINAAGGVNGKKIELVKYDTQSDPAVATSMATKLATQDKVIAIVAPATSGSYKAIVPVANANKVPIVSGSATADGATQAADGTPHPYAFRTCFSDSFQGSAMAVYAKNTLNAKSAVIFGDQSSDYAKGLAAAFKKQFSADGGTIVDEQAYTAGDTDFSATLTKIKAEKYDVIYLPGYYQEVGLIIKAARGLGITAPFLGGDGYDSPTLLELGGASALNDVHFTMFYSALDQDPKIQKFISDYKALPKSGGKEPSGFVAMGYDTLNFIVNAIKNASAPTGEAVATAMGQTKDWPGVTGTLSVDPATHNAIRSLVVITLKDGVQSSAEKVNAT